MTAQDVTGTIAAKQRAACDRSTQITKSLLGYGVLAGPLYALVAGVQAVTRPGFDPARHDVSLLANGPLGWIQITNFVVVGAMVVAAAVGIRRAARGRWAAGLVGVYGAGLIAAGAFRADPAFGFPPGTPAGPGAVSWHGLAHLAAGGIGFCALIAACFVFARRFAVSHRTGWAIYSAATGVVFFAGFAGIVTGSGQVVATIAFTVAVLLAWSWLSALSAHLYRHTASSTATATSEVQR